MMKRIPENDLMDCDEQASAYAGTDFSEPHDAFVSLFREKFSDHLEGNVLDLGCGTADVLIRFASSFRSVHVTGVDGAGAMLKIGDRDIKKAGLSDRIKLQKCFLPDNGLPHKYFDVVISNSLLHHIKAPSALWQTVKNCAKPGAPVFIMDLYRPENIQEAEQLVGIYAKGAPPVLKKDFYNSLLASYNIDEIIKQLSKDELHYLNVEIVSDRHLLVWGQIR